MGEALHVSDVLDENSILLQCLTFTGAVALDPCQVGKDFFGAVDTEDCPQELDEWVGEEEPAMSPIALVENSEKWNPYVVQMWPHHFLANRNQLLLDGYAM